MFTNLIAARPALGVGLVAPRDASAYFASKNRLLPSYHWDDVYAHEHAAGVAVAGITQRDVLQLFTDEIQRTIDAGGDLRNFKKRMQVLLAKAGYWGDVTVTDPATGEQRITKFNPKRLELIFNTNTRQAFAAGQYERALAAKATLPYLLYLSANDDKVRPLHRQWHGTVLPVGHAFWRTHMPPCGWNCRCKVVSVSERDIEKYAKLGVPIHRAAPASFGQYTTYTRKSTGEEMAVPLGIDPGFDHNPALSRLRGVMPQQVAPTVPVVPVVPVTVFERQISDMPAPTVISAASLHARALANASELEKIEWVLSQFGGALDKPVVFKSVMGLDLVIDKELFVNRKTGGYKVSKYGRDEWLDLMVQAIQAPDQVRTDYARDRRGNQRYRFLKQFFVQEDGRELPVLAVFELSRYEWAMDAQMLGGKSVHTALNKPDSAGKLLDDFSQGSLLVYDSRYGVVNYRTKK